MCSRYYCIDQSVNFMCSRKKFQMWRWKKFRVMVIY
ncbi:hypothetical protein CIPAW_11G087700 [Carya illinoinensis]|uniref:Uncharacterized protein n=1 Tax=Carya illinoinensis TaxID=32201 RepID=A0A8T1P2M3_CARIL|nr:hypothetical protein CIPAW_11G087700 [Carya illinoinensis]KAG6687725.1 hypothetical protein I3842_11G087600 [Carya illinoinensis]